MGRAESHFSKNDRPARIEKSGRRRACARRPPTPPDRQNTHPAVSENPSNYKRRSNSDVKPKFANQIGPIAAGAREPNHQPMVERLRPLAARQRGVDRAKAAERDLIQNGHPGTANEGDFTLAERKQIAETGEYPKDIRWHHINDVKRNPKLADVSDNVIPSRGGASGHVRNFHPYFTLMVRKQDRLDLCLIVRP